MPDVTKPFFIESDASDFASGAVLRQYDRNRDLHPCTYLSKGFSEAKRNYEIYDKELLGIIRANAAGSAGHHSALANRAPAGCGRSRTDQLAREGPPDGGADRRGECGGYQHDPWRGEAKWVRVVD